MSKLMGYQNQCFIGTAGSTAATAILNLVDLQESAPTAFGDGTVKGDGSAVPKKSHSPIENDYNARLSIKVDTSDAVLATLVAAAKNNTLMALRTKSYSSGIGFDGDGYFTMDNHTKQLRGEQVQEFTFVPNDSLRAWQNGV